MANYGYKQYNYSNVVNYKNALINNKDQMVDLFEKYKNELTNIESSWQGQSGSVSRDDMNRLIADYNGFINKVNEFISNLTLAENTFTEAEKQSMSTYNN